MIGKNVMPGDPTIKPGPGAHSPERVSRLPLEKQHKSDHIIRPTVKYLTVKLHTNLQRLIVTSAVTRAYLNFFTLKSCAR